MATASERADTVTLPNLDDVFEHNPDIVTTFSALQRISPEVLPLALAGLPYGTRKWAERHQLIAGEDDGLHLTDAGREVTAAAAAREPEPYANISFDELSAQTRTAIDELRVRVPQAALATPHRQPVEGPSQLIARLRERGREMFSGGSGEHVGR